ncbi:hypothetical protein F4604DRAFT_1678464 [Suillus subluteus]|nr:hypothetical protein F4604DRAFT_1678464 [Suillus subluteus]
MSLFPRTASCRFGSKYRFTHGEGLEVTNDRKRRRTTHERSQTQTQTPLDNFFAKYPEFKYNSSVSASLEFYRMCDKFGWDKEDKEREQASRDFKDSLVQQFNDIYGTDVNDLTSWRTLCQIVHVSPIPDTLKSCREVETRLVPAVKATHVNIVDLVDTERTGEPVTVFVSEVDLSKYTKLMGKFFPRDNAYDGGLLRLMMSTDFRGFIKHTTSHMWSPPVSCSSRSIFFLLSLFTHAFGVIPALAEIRLSKSNKVSQVDMGIVDTLHKWPNCTTTVKVLMMIVHRHSETPVSYLEQEKFAAHNAFCHW